MENRKRNIQMKFYVTEEEKRLIDEKMKQLPIKQYTEEAIKERIKGVYIAKSKPLREDKKIRLVVDIENSTQDGKGRSGIYTSRSGTGGRYFFIKIKTEGWNNRRD